jgi:membrane-bound serine protease (ClpP class)
MSTGILLLVLFGLGAVVLIAEIFIPSQGVLSLLGLAFLIAAVIVTFRDYGRGPGVLAVGGCLVFVPTMAILAVKYWHRTPIGRRISPPNPVLTDDDAGLEVEEIEALIGQAGEARTPLRPVGICEFGNQRVSCVAEYGYVETGQKVRAIGRKGGNLAVVVE